MTRGIDEEEWGKKKGGGREIREEEGKQTKMRKIRGQERSGAERGEPKEDERKGRNDQEMKRKI